MEPITLDTAYWARIPISNGYIFYDLLYVDCITCSMTDKYPTLHVTTYNGDNTSYYYKGHVPPEEVPPDIYDDIVLDLEPLDYHSDNTRCPAVDPAALNDFLS